MVDHIPHMVDMRQSPQEAADMYKLPSPADGPAYPYGLCISLTEKEIEKLNLDHDGCDVGDLIHLHCMAVVTSCSETKTMNNEPRCRIELQITHIAAEDEGAEDEEEDSYEDGPSRLYNSY